MTNRRCTFLKLLYEYSRTDITHLVRKKVSNKTLKHQVTFRKIRLELGNCKIAKMLHDIDNLVEMSRRLNRSPPFFQTVRETPGSARRPRTRHDKRLGRNRPISFMIVQRKPDQT